MGVAVADGAEVAVGVEVASEPQPAATKPRISIREIHPAFLIDDPPPEALCLDALARITLLNVGMTTVLSSLS